MALSPGTRLGAYEILCALGAGGMGEVYRARDPKLGRDVALKILPEAFAADADRVMRFEREARTLAALNHPHIAQVYGLEDGAPEGGVESLRALVMELVEGEDLAARLERGALPIEETLHLARQIAAALDAAHTNGIVHRDLKPANIKVRPDGTVKVLDFGLAKTAATGAPCASGAALLNSPTMTSPAMTMQGVILGTAAYMSPEQARGYSVDKRTDIWAFGCVLYEMLSGRSPFHGETLTDVLGAIVKSEPDLDALPAATPPRIRHLIGRCLRKDAAARLRDIGDAVSDLNDVAVDAPPAAAAKTRSGWRTAVPWAIAIVALGVAAAIGLNTRNGPRDDTSVRMLAADRDETILSPQISSDGASIVYVKNQRLVVRRLDELEPRAIPNTENAANPFWLPDGRSVGYFALGSPVELRTVSIDGGGERVLVSRANTDVRVSPFAPFGATSCGGSVVFVSWAQGLFRVREGQLPEALAPIDPSRGEMNWAYPSCLPDGRVMAVLLHRDKVILTVIDSSERRPLLELQEAIEWPVLADESLVLFQRGSGSGPNSGVWALPVARDLSAAASAPSLLLREALNPSISAAGRMVALTGWRFGDQQLVWVDRAGKRLGAFGRPQALFRNPAVSPDATRVAVTARVRTPDTSPRIWLHSATAMRQLTTQDTDGQNSPAWSPDGRRLAYVESGRLVVRAVDEAGDAQVVAESASDRALSWTADGTAIVYQEKDQLRITTVNKPGGSRTLLPDGSYPAISPDGRLLAYVASSMGRDEVFLTTLPEPGPVWPVSVEGGRRPRWHPTGGELFFTGGPRVGDDPNSHRELYVAAVSSGPRGVTVGAPQRLFDATALGLSLTSTSARAYDIAPDGRILIATTGLEGVQTVTVIETLDALLKARR
jgi:serine/threonine protein kinase/Tol biopolymer transport system component